MTIQSVLAVITKGRRAGSIPLAVVASLVSGAAAPVWAQQFTEAEIFVELNDTDEDLGLHASIDGGPYTRLTVEDPKGLVILTVGAQGRLAKQGLTQLFLESAEPSFEDLAPEAFFRRFPEGVYEIEGVRNGVEFEAITELSHVMAAPVDNVTVAGEPAAENCDAVPLPSVSEPVVIDWDPVTESHPDVGEEGDVEIDRYQFFVEQGDVKFAVDLPPTVTEFQVPSEILAPGGRFKFEIIARTDGLNNTAIENCFIVE